jgi:pimeloyl-ACP methyl ester carboxylesterase
MAGALPDARLVTIPDAGHLTAVEAPEEFNAAVAEFLAAVGL